MRSSLELPSHFFRYQIPGLSDVGHFLIHIGLVRINALWCASGGAAEYEPLQSAYDVFAKVISGERRLDEQLIGTTIPSLVAEAAAENRWPGVSMPLSRPLKPEVLKRVKELTRIPIARWTSTIPRTALCHYRLRPALTAVGIELSVLPRSIDEEPKDIIARRLLRQQAISAYKKKWRGKRKLSDKDIALECSWHDRTAIARFKSCDLRNKAGVDNRIWRVLRRSSGPTDWPSG